MDNLPDELLLRIFDYLPVDEDKFSAWNISLVSKRFHAVVQDTLYHDYSFHHGNPYIYTCTLCCNPNLARSVRRLTWGHDDTAFGMPPPLPALLTPPKKAHIISKIREYGSGSAIRVDNLFSQKTATSCEDGEYFLTVFQLVPRLEELKLFFIRDWSEAPWLNQELEHAHLWPRLSKISVEDWNVYLANVLPLLAFPYLRTLKLTVVQPEYRTNETNELDLGPRPSADLAHRLVRDKSPIQHLFLSGPYSTMASLSFVAKCCHNLKTLTVACKSWDDDHQQSAYETLFSLLACNSSTLEHVRYTDALSLPPPAYQEIVKLFKSMPHLQSLELDIMNFLPDEAAGDPCESLKHLLPRLPKTIEHFGIVFNDAMDDLYAGFDTKLFSVVPKITSLLPRLKTLALTNWDPLIEISACQTELSKLQNAFSKASVKFTSCARELNPTWSTHIHCLDYVEPDWVWVQPMAMVEGFPRWLRLIDRHIPFGQLSQKYVINDDFIDDEMIEAEEEDGWVVVEVMRTEVLDVDQYTVEQPIWFWEELQRRRLGLGSRFLEI
jgi:hypothetical protein